MRNETDCKLGYLQKRREKTETSEKKKKRREKRKEIRMKENTSLQKSMSFTSI
jgi:hypothetical protein